VKTMPRKNSEKDIPLIRYPRFKALHEEISLCQELTKLSGEPNCIYVEGQAGAGKTTLVLDYAAQFPRFDTDEGTTIPVFYAETPSPVTVKGMASHMLKVMGDPAYDKGTLTSMNGRLTGLAIDCGIKLFILDDFHHLIDSGTDHVLSEVSDWLKVLIKETNIPFLVVGIETKVEIILAANEQLARLFASRCHLEPFRWNPDELKSIQELGWALAARARSSIVSISMASLSGMDTLSVLPSALKTFFAPASPLTFDN
jgi:hypothetical protein